MMLRNIFDLLRGRPRDMSAEEVAGLLRKFRDDTASHSEWDYFCAGIRIADPRLEEIRSDAEELYGPRVEPYTSERLTELIIRAEAIGSKRE
jgi:hypothetical protein